MVDSWNTPSYIDRIVGYLSICTGCKALTMLGMHIQVGQHKHSTTVTTFLDHLPIEQRVFTLPGWIIVNSSYPIRSVLLVVLYIFRPFWSFQILTLNTP